MGRRWWGGGRRSWGSSWGDDGGWGKKSKKQKKSKSKPAAWRSAFDYLPNLDEPLDLLGLTQGGGRYGGLTVHTPRNNAIIDLELGLGESIPDFDDELDNEVLFGTVKGEIVGIQYYKGVVNNKEMVSLQREPRNKFDANAVKVVSAMGDQVGHIKRELAKALAWVMDNSKARVEGIVPRGAGNIFRMPVELTFWGRLENREPVNAHLRRHGFFMDMAAVPTVASSSQGPLPGTSLGTNRLMVSRKQLSNVQMAENLDGLFSSLDEADKTKEMEPTKGIMTPLFPHQKQALSWMVEKENSPSLPPFWKVVNGGMFYNTLTNFATSKRPDSVTGGILADDMGLGKTLEVIALILTNFVGNQPLAVPMSGQVRPSKIAKEERMRAYRKALDECDSDTEDYKPRKPRRSKGVKKKLNIKESFVVPEGEEECVQYSEETRMKARSSMASSMAKASSIMVKKTGRSSMAKESSTEKVESSETEEEMTDSDTTDSDCTDDGSRVVMMDSSDPEYVPEGCEGKKKGKGAAKAGSGKAGPGKTGPGKAGGKAGLGKGKAGPAAKNRPKRTQKAKVVNYDDGSSTDDCEVIATPPDNKDSSDPKLPEDPTGQSQVTTPSEPTVVETTVVPPTEPTVLPPVGSPVETPVEPVVETPLSQYVIPQLDGAFDEAAGGRPKRNARKPTRYASEEEGSPRKKAKLEPKKAVRAAKPLRITTTDDNQGQEGPAPSVVKAPTQGKPPQAARGKATKRGAAKGKGTKTGKENAQTPLPGAPSALTQTPLPGPPAALAGVTMGTQATRIALGAPSALNEAPMETQAALGIPEAPVGTPNPKAAPSAIGIASQIVVSSHINTPEVVKKSSLNPTAAVFVPKAAPQVLSGPRPLVSGSSMPSASSMVAASSAVVQAQSRYFSQKTATGNASSTVVQSAPRSRFFSQSGQTPGAFVKSLAAAKLGKFSGKKQTSGSQPALPTLHNSDSDDLPDLSGDLALNSDPVNPMTSDPMAGSSGQCDIPNNGRTQTTDPRGTLIVCPLSVLSNWLDQLEDHVDPSVLLEVYTYYGSGRTKNPKVLAEQDIVITTYATLANDAKGKNPLGKVDWLRLVLDEGHTIRNPNAQQTKAILAIKAKRKWVLTGTPIQNSMQDLYSIVNFLGIAPLNDRHMWLRTIERPILQGDESAFKRVQQLMKSVAMRRMKTQEVNGKPLVNLPEKKVFVETLKLTDEERKVYDSMANEGKIIVSRYFRQGTLLHHYGEVLAILMRLRQICCHPFLVAKAAKAMTEIVDTAEKSVTSSTPEELRKQLVAKVMEVMKSGSDEECSICLDPLRSPVITHCAHLFCRPCIELCIRNEQPNARCPLCRGEVKQNELVEVPPDADTEEEDCVSGPWQSSSKVDALLRGLITLRAEDKTIKSLVVSQFTSFLNILEKPLSENGFKFVRLDGTMSSKQRITAMEAFSDTNPSSPTIFLLSLKAGGVGLNLVAASRVFLMEPAWNPASEEQCFDRCHRLGQTREVIITKYIIEDSVEGRMMELQEKKRSLMNGAFGQKQTADEKRRARINDLKTLMDI